MMLRVIFVCQRMMLLANEIKFKYSNKKYSKIEKKRKKVGSCRQCKVLNIFMTVIT